MPSIDPFFMPPNISAGLESHTEMPKLKYTKINKHQPNYYSNTHNVIVPLEKISSKLLLQKINNHLTFCKQKLH